MSSYHCWYQLVLTIVNLLAVVCTILVVLSSLGLQYGFHEPFPDLLDNATADVDAAFTTPITPTSWIHVTWLVVYFWMFLWSTNAMVSTCRKHAGVPVYVNPCLVNTPLLLFSTSACLVTIAWFRVYDREYITTATLLCMCVSLLSWSAYTLSVYTLYINLTALKKAEREWEAWLHRLLVQNGLAMLGIWSLYVTMLNLCTSLIHNKDFQVDKETAAVISLSALAFHLIVVLILDVTVLDRLTRYTFLHYVIPIVVLCSIIFRQDAWESDNVVYILLATMIAFTLLATMIKAMAVSCRIMTSHDDPIEEKGDGVVSHRPQQHHHYLSDGPPQGPPYQHYLSSASTTGYDYYYGHSSMRK